jgi:exodeoxyribonuclease V alpha subunit
MNQMIRPSHVDQRPALETLAGSIERITFHNPENGFAVLKVQARGKRDLITVVGHTPSVSAGEWITASGLWISDRTHGLQFKAEVLKTTPPTGAEGIEKYLASGQMRGIGPAMAKRINSLRPGYLRDQLGPGEFQGQITPVSSSASCAPASCHV